MSKDLKVEIVLTDQYKKAIQKIERSDKYTAQKTRPELLKYNQLPH